MNADARIRELVRANLSATHEVDGVRFIDELLLVAAEVGEIQCSLAGARGLRFQTPEQPAWEVELDRAKSKLRMVCARLAVLCAGGAAPDLYGGEGTVAVDVNAGSENGEKSTNRILLNVQFANTPGDVWFALRGEGRPAAPARASEQLHA